MESDVRAGVGVVTPEVAVTTIRVPLIDRLKSIALTVGNLILAVIMTGALALEVIKILPVLYELTVIIVSGIFMALIIALFILCILNFILGSLALLIYCTAQAIPAFKRFICKNDLIAFFLNSDE